METFRQIFREAMRILRASVAMVGRLATAPFRALDDAADLAARVLARFFGPTPVAPDDDVHDAIEDNHDADEIDALEESRRRLGSYARRAAAERLEHGVVVSPDIPATIKNWVSVLPRSDLRTLVANGDVAVGRHLAGEDTIRDNIGAAIRLPDAVADEAAYRERLKERERRERAHDQAAGYRPSRRPAAAPTLVPSI